MASHISWVLQKVIVERLQNDEDLIEKINKRVYDVTPPNPIFPYVVLGQDTIKAWNSKTSLGHDISFIIHIFTRDKSRMEMKDIIVKIIDALKLNPLYLEANLLIYLMPELVQSFVELDQMTCHGIIRLHALAAQKPG
ncbi:MAG: DUF3168 domain-containing protein [Alphaproteobacteria bacterium]|nr:DUF3168 domain-containing protein [Alphaproteobacteria bacterium]